MIRGKVRTHVKYKTLIQKFVTLMWTPSIHTCIKNQPLDNVNVHIKLNTIS